MEYKYIELLSIKFAASSMDIVRQQVTFRYHSIKEQLGHLQSRLVNVTSLVKLQSPGLLQHIQHPPGLGGVGS